MRRELKIHHTSVTVPATDTQAPTPAVPLPACLPACLSPAPPARCPSTCLFGSSGSSLLAGLPFFSAAHVSCAPMRLTVQLSVPTATAGPAGEVSLLRWGGRHPAGSRAQRPPLQAPAFCPLLFLMQQTTQHTPA